MFDYFKYANVSFKVCLTKFGAPLFTVQPPMIIQNLNIKAYSKGYAVVFLFVLKSENLGIKTDSLSN